MKIFMCVCLVSLAVAKTTFNGDEILNILPTNSDQASLIKGLNNDDEMVDFLIPKNPTMITPNNPVKIRVPSGQIPSVKRLLLDNGIDFKVDVQELSEKHDYKKYNKYETIVEWAKQMTVAHPGLASTWSLETSYEGRRIPIIQITTNFTNPEMLVDCGFYAREWISPAFCQCYTNYLLEGYGTDPEITKILDELTIYIIPVVNVDGYAYSHTNDRMWQKTRSYHGSGVCAGVDPNRNCRASWGGPGSSSSPCAETYRGPYVESELEVKAVADFIRSRIRTLKAYITFHAYGQMILFPYSYTMKRVATHALLSNYSQQAAAAVSKLHGTKYTYGEGAWIADVASGRSDDFAYDAGVPLSFTIKLRDKGHYGYRLPESQIEEVCDETYNMMRVFENAAREV